MGTPLGPIIGLGKLANPGTSGGAITLFTNTISTTIGVLTVSAGIWFIFQLFGGAFGWVSAGSDKQALDAAQKRIVNSLTGLFIVVASYLIIGLVSLFFGIDILNLSTLINQVGQ